MKPAVERMSPAVAPPAPLSRYPAGWLRQPLSFVDRDGYERWLAEWKTSLVIQRQRVAEARSRMRRRGERTAQAEREEARVIGFYLQALRRASKTLAGERWHKAHGGLLANPSQPRDEARP